jgi:DNA polymerase III subunit epsilon
MFDWRAEGIRLSALEFVAYSLGFFHDGHRAASDCQATLHALAQPLPGTRRLALQVLLEQARQPTWRLWAKDAAIHHWLIYELFRTRPVGGLYQLFENDAS